MLMRILGVIFMFILSLFSGNLGRNDSDFHKYTISVSLHFYSSVRC